MRYKQGSPINGFRFFAWVPSETTPKQGTLKKHLENRPSTFCMVQPALRKKETNTKQHTYPPLPRLSCKWTPPRIEELKPRTIVDIGSWAGGSAPGTQMGAGSWGKRRGHGLSLDLFSLLFVYYYLNLFFSGGSCGFGGRFGEAKGKRHAFVLSKRKKQRSLPVCSEWAGCCSWLLLMAFLKAPGASYRRLHKT